MWSMWKGGGDERSKVGGVTLWFVCVVAVLCTGRVLVRRVLVVMMDETVGEVEVNRCAGGGMPWEWYPNRSHRCLQGGEVYV